MPRISPHAPDLVASPGGAWLARLDPTELSIYDLSEHGSGDGLPLPVRTLPRPPTDGPAHIGFVSAERLLCLSPYRTGEEVEGAEVEQGLVAELLSVPQLDLLGQLDLPGVVRVLGVGPGGAVVAPAATGAELVVLRGPDLYREQTFLRGDVLSAAPAPERRWLLELRSGHELWDPAARRAVARLTLATRQPLLQVGFAAGGKMIWTLASAVPVHLELFRSSDGRQLYEVNELGRPLRAEAGLGRLIVAFAGDDGTHRFLDLDLVEQELRHVTLPPGQELLGFAVRAHIAAEILALVAAEGSDEPRLQRLPLTPLKAQPEPPRRRPPAEKETKESPFLSRARGRGESDRRPPPGPAAGERRPASGERRPPPPPRQAPPPQPSEDREDEDEPVPVVHIGGPPEAEPEPVLPPSGRRRLRPLRLLSRRGPAQGPAAWQCEVMRWTQLLLLERLPEASPPGGPLQSLSARLGLSPLAQQIVCLLYGVQVLLHSHKDGLAPAELAQLLGLLSDEAMVLAELLPGAPLARHGLLLTRPGGKVRLTPEVMELCAGAPCPGLVPAGRPGARPDRLDPGLYLCLQYAAPALLSLGGAIAQPILRLDALLQRRPIQALRQALRRALLHDAVVLIDGLPGLAFPVFAGERLERDLRPLLDRPNVPVIVCAAPGAMGGLGLPARLVQPLAPPADAPAPPLPSAPLPPGTYWRAPSLQGRAAFLDGTLNPPGVLEPIEANDPRAAILLGPTATPDDYARAAALAARDGAVLSLDTNLSPARAAVLAVLLRQIPVLCTALPPGEGGTWPPELARLLGE